ncbi:MAG: metallophosphoesterase [Bacteroidales bacterium]|nr:metallophosphoesterase [Bacteroidales bacterium]
MKPIQLIVFLSIVIGVYSAANYFIYSRGMAALPAGSPVRSWFPWVFLFLSSSYIVARFLERIWISPVSDAFTWIGSYWLGIMIYLLLSLLLIDILRLIHLIAPIYPKFLTADPVAGRYMMFKIVLAISIITVIAGSINALNPRTRVLDVKIGKKAGSRKQLNIVMASDIHMGTLVGPRRTERMVEKINALKPDIILFAGDLVDEDLAPVIRHDLGRSLLKLSAPLGVYAITGNHEYIGGAERAVKYLEDHGIIVLRDTAVLIDNCFYIAGRDDRDKERFSGKARKTIAEILKNADLAKPVIMMDHQPFKLDDVQAAGVDLQFSGHTHHGQIWPFNYITKALFEVSWGYKQKGNSQFYVSSGYGGWGPPVRTGNRPELVNIRIEFQQ